MFGLLRRIAARLSSERRELDRLAALPRGTPATTRLIRPAFETLDGGSFAAQYREIFQHEAFVFHPLAPSPRILDCGANVGTFTVFCHQRFRDASITSFEPDPQVFACLARNVHRCCGATDNITLVQAAVIGGEAPSVAFHADHCDAGRTTRHLAGGTTTQVRAVRLRDYLSEPCDLLKLDIEGAEVDVLNDCVERLKSVANIFVEFHSFLGHPQRLDELFAVLAEADFRLFVKGGRVLRKPFVDRDEFLGMDGQLDIWGVRT